MTIDRDHGVTLPPLTPERARLIVDEYLRLCEQQGIEAAVDYLQRQILRATIIEPMARELGARFTALAEGASCAAVALRGPWAVGGVAGQS